MKETILVTENEFAKAKPIFGNSPFNVRPVSEDEAMLARAVLSEKARAIIVGVNSYCDSLYDALGNTGGDKGSLIARFGVGHDGIDKRIADLHNIFVTNTPGVLDASVAEHTIWLLGSLARRIPIADRQLRNGRFVPIRGRELHGKRIAVVGFGSIGRRVARAAALGLGMVVTAVDIRTIEELARDESTTFEQLQRDYGIAEYTTDLDRALREADVVTLHVPAAPGASALIDANRLGSMRAGAMLINTARGSLIDESALHDALTCGHLFGAALDVFAQEPYQPPLESKDLRVLDNVILSPHMGSNTQEANKRMAEICLKNARNFFSGRLEMLDRVFSS